MEQCVFPKFFPFGQHNPQPLVQATKKTYQDVFFFMINRHLIPQKQASCKNETAQFNNFLLLVRAIYSILIYLVSININMVGFLSKNWMMKIRKSYLSPKQSTFPKPLIHPCISHLFSKKPLAPSTRGGNSQRLTRKAVNGCILLTTDSELE